MRKVIGSSPISSTKKKPHRSVWFFFLVNDGLEAGGIGAANAKLMPGACFLARGSVLWIFGRSRYGCGQKSIMVAVSKRCSHQFKNWWLHLFFLRVRTEKKCKSSPISSRRRKRKYIALLRAPREGRPYVFYGKKVGTREVRILRLRIQGCSAQDDREVTIPGRQGFSLGRSWHLRSMSK